MQSKLAAFFLDIGAKTVSPDVDAMTHGVGDLRYAMGVQALPEDKPVAYFLFHNADTGPEPHYSEASLVNNEASGNALNRINANVARNPDAWGEREFDRQHCQEMARVNTRPTMPANMAMAVSIDSPEQFEDLLTKAGRAFRRDARGLSDLTLTVAYVPPVGASWPMEPPYQVTFQPHLAPLRNVEPPSQQALRDEPELYDARGARAARDVRNLLRNF